MRMGEFYTNEGTGTLSAIFLETYKKDFFTNIAGPVPLLGRSTVALKNKHPFKAHLTYRDLILLFPITSWWFRPDLSIIYRLPLAPETLGEGKPNLSLRTSTPF